MHADQVRARDLLDVIRAAAAHPAVGHADEREAVQQRLRDRDLGRVLHRDHAGMVAAVEQDRHHRSRASGGSACAERLDLAFSAICRIFGRPEYS